MAKSIRLSDPISRQFIKIFMSLCHTWDAWRVWSDFVTLFAVTIARSVSTEKEKYDTDYREIMNRYRQADKETFMRLAALMVDALEKNPDQDFLGKIFMALDLGSHWKGQFFTPYNVSCMMAAIQAEHVKEQICRQGWVSVSDPACGAGSMLIAFRNEAIRQGISSNEILFVAQDVDRIAALMCYVQLSLLGCAGYVIVADSISNPPVGISPLLPIQKQGQEYWFMPMFFTDVWHKRQKVEFLKNMQGKL